MLKTLNQREYSYAKDKNILRNAPIFDRKVGLRVYVNES